MSKTLIAVIAGVVVVGGGAYYLMSSGALGGTGSAQSEQETASVGSTFASAFASGQNLECTFSHDDGAGNVSSGTVYIANGGAQLRGDFVVTSPTANEAHMIRSEGYNYLWGSAMQQGVKTAVTEENAGQLFNDDSGTIDPDTEYKCAGWNVDNNKFTLPAGVEFIDMSAQIEAATGASGGASVKAQQCAACNELPAGPKEQCLAALQC